MKLACRLLAVLVALLGLFGLFLLAVENSKAKTARYGAYPSLKKAYDHYAAFGEITNSAPNPVGRVFPFTNTVRIRDVNYPCILAVQWEHFSCATGTVVAITTDGKTAVWLEPGKPTKAVPMPARF